MQLGREATAARRQASRLAGLAGGDPLHPGLRAVSAQGARGTCSLAVKLPPLGDGPRGSRVWCGSLPVGKFIPPFGDRSHGSHKGQCPLTPDCAPQARRGVGRHASWPGFYRRSATGLAARGFGAVPCQLVSSYRHSATGLMARYKGQREIKITLAFCVAENPKTQRSIPTCKGCV